MASTKSDGTQKRAVAKTAAASKKAGPAKTTPAAKKQAATGKPVDDKARPARKRRSTPAPAPVVGTLDIGREGGLVIRTSSGEYGLEWLAERGEALLVLQIDLKKSEALASGNHERLLNLLDEFLKERAKLGITGSATCC